MVSADQSSWSCCPRIYVRKLGPRRVRGKEADGSPSGAFGSVGGSVSSAVAVAHVLHAEATLLQGSGGDGHGKSTISGQSWVCLRFAHQCFGPRNWPSGTSHRCNRAPRELPQA